MSRPDVVSSDQSPSVAALFRYYRAMSRQSSPASGRAQDARRRYRGMTADEFRAERRARLFESALELFTSRGYVKTPIALLCAEAGVSTRHFYELYADREALLCDVFDQLVLECSDMIAAALATPVADPFDRIATAIRAFLQFGLEDDRRARLVCLQMVGVSEHVEAHRRRNIRRLTALIAEQAQRFSETGALPRRDYTTPALMLTGAVNELIIDFLTAENPPTIEELAREMNLFFRAMLIGAQAYTPR